MRRPTSITLAVFLFLSLAVTQASAAPSVDPVLAKLFKDQPLGTHAVVITFNRQPTSSDITSLKLMGIKGGIVLNKLPMVLTGINKAQYDALRSRSDIVSLYANRIMRLQTNVSRTFIGVTALRTDAEVTRQNGGLPVSGKGVGVAIVDTGIDATHADLQLGKTVRQNVYFPLVDLSTLGNCPAVAGEIIGVSGVPGVVLEQLGFAGPVFAENQPMTDVEGGHGTFVSGVVAGNGQQSGGFYGGMAPGAHLVGLMAGNDCGLPEFGILQAFDYVLVKQVEYNIRVVNNSWGSVLGDGIFDPNDPINIATRRMHDHNITVVFAAGNSGSIPGAINPYSTAPWVISVAASIKEGLGTPTDFSSRGQDNGTGTDVAGMPADPNAVPNLRPDLTAPGADIKSTRSKGTGITNVAGTIPLFVGSNDLQTIPPAFLPFYTTSRGTSFSSPHVAGVVALLMEANPLLTPDEVVNILRSTATPMPYEERVVGAGYLDAHNAVRAAMGLSAVPHPANLFPGPDTPEISDPAGDQLGTAAQDIRQGTFRFDAATNQLVYTLEVTDLSTLTTHMRWTMASHFGDSEIFVYAETTETGGRTFGYGSIAPDPDTGINTQTDLGVPDSGEILGNSIVWRLGLDKINTAVGFDVLGTVSTASVANGWILIGTTVTGGLLLNSDEGTGRDFTVGSSEPPPPPPPPPADPYCERFAGAFDAAAGTVEVPVKIQLSELDAKLNFHPGSESVTLQLFDSNGLLVASANSNNGKRIVASGLAAGDYSYRLSGSLSKAVDYVINSCQANPAE
jgi:subtilisin family serine protease